MDVDLRIAGANSVVWAFPAVVAQDGRHDATTQVLFFQNPVSSQLVPGSSHGPPIRSTASCRTALGQEPLHKRSGVVSWSGIGRLIPALDVESFSVTTRFKVHDLDTRVSHELLSQVE